MVNQLPEPIISRRLLSPLSRNGCEIFGQNTTNDRRQTPPPPRSGLERLQTKNMADHPQHSEVVASIMFDQEYLDVSFLSSPLFPTRPPSLPSSGLAPPLLSFFLTPNLVEIIPPTPTRPF